MLTVLSWKWGAAQAEHVNIHKRMIARTLKRPHRYLCVTDDTRGVQAETFPLWDDLSTLVSPHGVDKPSCYRRLKIFDPETTRAMGIRDDDIVLSIDLDVVAIKDLDFLLSRGGDADFIGWIIHCGWHHRTVNGTIFMLRAGRLPHIWHQFDPAKSPAIARHSGYFGTDQGWLSLNLAHWPGWTREDGVVPFTGDLAHRSALPPHTRLVSFHGTRKPWDEYVQKAHPWILEHWR